jgi:hypothetical protein
MANNVTTIRQPSEVRSMLGSLRQRYAEWTLDADPPPTAERDAAVIRAHCAPADPRLLAVELKRTVDLFPAPNDPNQSAALSEALMEALEDAPLDIAQAALKRVRMECKWFPKPAEIRERVIEELGERKRAALKAEVAASMAAPTASSRSRKLKRSARRDRISL